MPFKVSVIGLKEFERTQIQFLQTLSEKQLQEIAEKTEQVMRFHIQTSIQRPGSTSNLANSFKAERINIGSWGVGNIPALNQDAPYWRWINYGRAASGRTIPPGSSENPHIRGGFTPGNSPPSPSAFQEGRFQLNGTYFMNPKKPIQAHNFIARTLTQVPTIVNSVLSKGEL